MAMTACYRNFDIPQISQGVSHSHHLVTNHQARHLHSLQHLQTAAVTALSPALPQLSSQQQPQKDYSIPLHVDCSVEYELPNQAKPPVGARVEPLLMIHPCYFRKMESQRRSPFINNMPNQQPSHISQSSSISSNSIDSSNSNRSLRQHSSASSSRHHSHITQSTSHHHNQLPGSSNMQLPSSTTSASSSSARIRSTQHQQQINLQQQIDEYVQRQIVQMSAPPPPSITYSTITNSHNTSQHNSQSTSSNNNNNNHYLVQQSQRAPSTWDPYSISNVGQHHKSMQQQHQQQQKIIQCHNAKQASHITNSIIEGGGLLCTGRWGDVIEKTSSMAAIPRDYQSGPECIPNIKTNISNQTTANMYRNTVGKRDAMLSGGCNMYNGDNTATEISQATAMWKADKASIPREYQLESNNNANKVVSNSKSSSSNNNNMLSSTSSSNHQNNHNYNTHNSLSAQVAQAAQDQRHLLSGKYKQYLRSQRMHPYSMLPSGMTTAAGGSAFPQLGATPTMFQQVSCFNV